MHVLAVIPARAGSKGVPGKNIKPLDGRPLLAYSVDAARESRTVTRVMVSTDNEEIARVARAAGAEVPFLRPAALAGDTVPMLETLQQVVTALRSADGYHPDVIVLLQPTSPLRTAAHVDAAVTLLLETSADSVVTVVDVPHQFNPVSVMRVDAGRLVPFSGNGGFTQRQDKPHVVARNGPAVIAVRTPVLEAGSLYGNDCRPLPMTAEESIDIDTPYDFELAEWALARRRAR